MEEIKPGDVLYTNENTEYGHAHGFPVCITCQLQEEDSEIQGDWECECTHKRSQHESDIGCIVFINEFMGDCPCVKDF